MSAEESKPNPFEVPPDMLKGNPLWLAAEAAAFGMAASAPPPVPDNEGPKSVLEWFLFGVLAIVLVAAGLFVGAIIVKAVVLAVGAGWEFIWS